MVALPPTCRGGARAGRVNAMSTSKGRANRAVRTLFLLGACALFTPAVPAAPAAPAWDWSQPVRYAENHDPAMVALADGRDLSVLFAEITFEDVDKWPKDKALVLGYRDGAGVVLFDADSGKSLLVLHGLEDQHPIDLLLKRCLDRNGTTLGDIDCHAAAERRWDAELNRAYRLLLGALDPPHAAALRTAQQQWLKFRDAERSAIDAVYDREGTLWKVVDARRRMELVRERALRLGSLYEGW